MEVIDTATQETLFWLSWRPTPAQPVVGACIVRAPDAESAARKAVSLGIAFTGKPVVMAIHLSVDKVLLPTWTSRKLTLAEAQQINTQVVGLLRVQGRSAAILG